MKSSQEQLSFAACGAILLVGLLLPLLLPALELLRSGSTGLTQAARLLSSPGVWQLLFRSVTLAGVVTVGALILGVPMAVLLFRSDVHAARELLALHSFPMLIPPFFMALGWFHLFGRQGYLGTPSTASILFSPAGATLVLSATFAPVVTVLVGLSLSHVDPSLEEAARVVARPWRAIRRIVLPLAWPAAMLAGLLVFSLALSEMGVPMFLRVRAYPGAVFARLGGIDYAPGEAFALVLPLAAVSLVILGMERRLRARLCFPSLGPRAGAIWRAPLGHWRGLASGVCWGLVTASLAPLVCLTARALHGGGFREVSRWIGTGFRNSLIPACIAATSITAVALVVGRALVRRTPGSAFFESLAVLTFVTPAAVVGVGLIALWNRPSASFVYHGTAIIVLGYLARYSVIAIRTVAVVFQDLALWPHLTIRGNLEFVLQSQGVAAAERSRRIEDMIARVDLSARVERYPGELSGGEKQRVAIARALVLEPAAILLDEPLSSLDVALKQELLGQFRTLFHERGLAGIYVTHDLREAASLGDRIAVLEDGHLVQVGTLDAIRGAPASPFVCALVDDLAWATGPTGLRDGSSSRTGSCR